MNCIEFASVSTRLRPVAALLCALLGGCQTLPHWAQPSLSQEQQIRYVSSRDFFLLPDQQMVGTLYSITTRNGDSLPDIARHYGLGYNDIVLANPDLDPWAPRPGSRVLLPMRHIMPAAAHKGAVLNLSNMRLFFYPPGENAARVYTYPVGIGREGWETPTGAAQIMQKKANPSWTPPQSVRREHAEKGDPLPRVVPAGPDNPLGSHALRLSIPGYLIHGTNKPYGVGLPVSHGCIRLYPEDIEAFFDKVAVGTPVRIVNRPYLLAWHFGDLYLEAHPPLGGSPKTDLREQKRIRDQIEREAAKSGAVIDWAKVEGVLQRRDGIPTPVLAHSPDLETLAASAPALVHPGRFFGQPEVPPLTPDGWSLAVASFDDEDDARRMAAMLIHQGPPIPARSRRQQRSYQVIAGPFKDEKEVLAVVERLRRDFELDTRPLAPGAAWEN